MTIKNNNELLELTTLKYVVVYEKYKKKTEVDLKFDKVCLTICI